MVSPSLTAMKCIMRHISDCGDPINIQLEGQTVSFDYPALGGNYPLEANCDWLISTSVAVGEVRCCPLTYTSSINFTLQSLYRHVANSVPGSIQEVQLTPQGLN